MGFVTNGVCLCTEIVNACREPHEKMSFRLDSKKGITARISDVVISITLITLGILAYLKILPLPANMIEPFTYGSIVAGGLNLLTSMVFEFNKRLAGYNQNKGVNLT